MSLFHALDLRKLCQGGLLVALLSMMTMGCANMRARDARIRYIHEQTARHRYTQPCSTVLPDVRELLFQDGFSVKTVDPSSQTLETEWLLTDRDERGDFEMRYLVQSRSPTPDTCALSITLNTATPDNVNTSRDLDFEWTVLQRVSPAKAQEIITEADAVYFSSGGS